MWAARLLLADTEGRWWTDAQLENWARQARQSINERLLWDVRATSALRTGGSVSIAGIDGYLIRVDGVKESEVDGWVRNGNTVQFVRDVPDGTVEVEWLPSSPQLPEWAEAGVPLYVAARAYAAYGPNMSIPKSERWMSLWNMWLAALRDIDSQRFRRRKLQR